METYALLRAASLNAGTVLAIAALGLLINEKSGVVNLGADRGRIVRESIAVIIADLEAKGDQSILARRLRGQ